MEETDVQGQGSETQSADNTGNPVENPTADFAVPEAYKESGWASNIHSVDDLWKQHANAQKLIGKKTIGIPGIDSSAQEIEDFYAKVRPESMDGYEFDLESEEDNNLFRDVFYKNGISARQAKSITEAYKDSVRKTTEGLFSQEGLDKALQDNIGDNYKEKANKITGFIKQYAKPSVQKMIDQMPNDVMGMLYGIINTTMEKYGTTELGAVDNKGTTKAESDLVGYIKASEELSLVPHTAEDERNLKIKYGVIKNA